MPNLYYIQTDPKWVISLILMSKDKQKKQKQKNIFKGDLTKVRKPKSIKKKIDISEHIEI